MEMTKILVVDTSIARAAGGLEASNAQSLICTRVLRAILDVCHRLAYPTSIREEWKEHCSRFTRKWLVEMISRKKVAFSDVTFEGDFHDKLLQLMTTERDREALEKDLRLLDSAWAFDKVILSLDDTMRALLSRHIEQVSQLRALIWLNPCDATPDTLRWLQEKAPFRPEYCLSQTIPER